MQLLMQGSLDMILLLSCDRSWKPKVSEFIMSELVNLSITPLPRLPDELLLLLLLKPFMVVMLVKVCNGAGYVRLGSTVGTWGFLA